MKKQSKMKLLPMFVALIMAAGMATSCKTSEQRAEILFHTTEGDFKMALFNETPLHRDAYLLLTRCGYFDSILFHRTIENFVAQAGDPNSRRAKPGEMLGDGEPFRIPAEICYPKLYHRRGMVNAAREGDDVNPNRESCGSQFAIMTCGPLTDKQIEGAQERVWKWTNHTVTIPDSIKKVYREQGGSPHLDGQYTVFGQIVDGMDVVDKIQAVKTDKNDRPIRDIRILKAMVVQDYKCKK